MQSQIQNVNTNTKINKNIVLWFAGTSSENLPVKLVLTGFVVALNGPLARKYEKINDLINAGNFNEGENVIWWAANRVLLIWIGIFNCICICISIFSSNCIFVFPSPYIFIVCVLYLMNEREKDVFREYIWRTAVDVLLLFKTSFHHKWKENEKYFLLYLTCECGAM